MFVRSRLLAVSLPLFLEVSLIACDEGRDGVRSASPVARTDAGEDRGPSTGPSTGGADADAPCHLRPWAPPRRIEVVSTSLEEEAPSLTADALSIVFHVQSAHDGGTRYELWTAKRDTLAAPFSIPERLAGAGSEADDAYPALTSDGVTLVFSSRRLDPAGPYRLFRAERPDVTVSFSAATPIASADAGPSGWPAGSAIYPFLTPDRTMLYFAADQGGDGYYRVYRSDRLENGELAAPVREESVDDAKSSMAFVMSTERLTLFVSRSDGDGRYLIHSAMRASVEDPFGPLMPVDALNSGAVDARMGWLSPDGCRSYLTRRSASAGGQADNDVDIYSSERQP